MGKRLLYQNSMEETLQQLLQDREQQLMQINRELQHLPGGSLHIRKRNGRIFVCEYSNGREKSVTREKDRIYRLTRKAYLERQAKKLKEECNWLKRSIAKFRKNSFRELDEEFLRKFNFLDLRRACWDQKKYAWMTASYRKNTLYPENLKYATNWGIKMRSKSERTIGNKLEEYGVAYRYDSLVDLDLATVSPDFQILKPDWTIAFWEHFGKEGDPEYDKSNARKIEVYHEAGFWEHSNLIITREKDLENPELLEDIIERFLLR